MPELFFNRPAEGYKRDINPVGHYIEDMSFYLSKVTGSSLDYCREFVRKTIKSNGALPLKNPKVKYFERVDYADRHQRETTLLGYIKSSIQNHEIIAPTLTTYVNPKERESLLRVAMKDGIAGRNKNKKAKFVHKQRNEMFLYRLKDSTEKLMKVRNNSYSGAAVSASTPLVNKTAHSSLTSTCRSTSGYGNANNEKLVAGNRHYYHPDVVITNIITISRLTDLNLLQTVIEEYNLHYPTVEEVMEVIQRSAELYWSFKTNCGYVDQITDLVNGLTALERAAFCYAGDLYHIKKFNDQVVRDFIMRLSHRSTQQIENAGEVAKKIDERYIALAKQICAEEAKGIVLNEIEGMPAHNNIIATALNVIGTLKQYRNFIQAFFVTDNVPAAMAQFPDSIRRIALLSDTDSTIFTVQDWVQWYCGRYCFGEIADAVAATIIFIAAESITHVLALMSKNIGIEDELLFDIAMKNEYKFPTFTPTPVAKHYFANISVQEGNVYKKLDEEIKGVNLKNSNVPAEVIEDAQNLMRELMTAATEEKDIYLAPILKRIADMERHIDKALRMGDKRFYRSGRVSDADSYKLAPDKSPYQHFVFWNEVFAPSYGLAPEPPYATISATMELNSPTKIKTWSDTFEDRGLAERLHAYLEKTGKKSIGTIALPYVVVSTYGVPKEILSHMKIRELVFKATSIYYLIMESMGIVMVNDNLTRMFYDQY